MASQLPEDAWAGEWRKFVSHAGNPCGSPSPVLRRRVQNSITRSRQNQPPRAPKWALGGLRRNRRWEALRPPLRGGKRVSGRTFWELLLQRTLEACETMKHGSKSTCLERSKSLQNRPRFSSNRSRNKNLTRDRTRRWTAGPANLWLCYGLLSRSSERAPGLVSCREVPMGRQNLRARFRTSFSVNGFFPRRNQKINSILLRSLHCSPHVAIRPHNKLCRLIALVPTI